MPLPPRDLRLVDDELFVESGRRQVAFLAKLTDFGPDQTVLDVGCGAGRHALAFAEYLDPVNGQYVGVDVSAEKIQWCADNIAVDHPNFRFEHLDVASPYFNPGGTASSLQLPFNGASFDLVVFWSVLSHVLPGVVSDYLDETIRVLKPGGHAFVTGYIWDDDTESVVEEGNGRFTFPHDFGNYRVQRPDIHEWAVAYPEDVLMAWIASAGFEVKERRPGDWRESPTQNQDILILQRPAATESRRLGRERRGLRRR